VLSASEIARGTQGALGFLRLDRAAPLHFDNTMSVCLRSFRVMILVAPLQAVLLLLRYSNLTYAVDDLELVLVEALHYVVDWLLFPVIFYEVARLRGWLDRYPRYIGALNWINLPVLVVAIIGSALVAVMPTAVGIVIELGLQALIFYWFLMTTRMALGVSWPIAARATGVLRPASMSFREELPASTR